MKMKWVVLVLLLGGCGPSHRDSNPQPAPVALVQPSAERLPSSLPEHTRVLVRARPAASGGEVLEVAHSVAEPGVLEFLDLDLGYLLTGERGHEGAPSPPHPDRHLLLAVTFEANAPLLDALRDGHPVMPDELTVQPLHGRLFVPTENPTGLMDEIQALCAAESEPCPRLLGLSGEEGYAIVDVSLLGSADEIEPLSEGETSFSEGETVALRAFLDDRVKQAVYWRAGQGPEISGFWGVRLTRGLLEDLPPEFHDTALLGVPLMVADAVRMSDPTLLEYEDLTWRLIEDGPEREALELVRTRTRNGARIHEVEAPPLQAPSIDLEDADFEIEWRRDLQRVEAATTPSWLTELEPHGRTELEPHNETARRALLDSWSGADLRLLPMLEAPHGYLKLLERLAAAAGERSPMMELPGFGDRLSPRLERLALHRVVRFPEGLHGVRARFRWVTNGRWRFEGGAVYVVEPGSHFERELQAGLASQQRVGENISVTETQLGDHHAIQVARGDVGDLFGDPTPVGSPRARFDRRGMGMAWQALTWARGMPRSPVPSSSFEFRAMAGPEVEILRLQHADRPWAPPKLPEVDLVDPEGPSECFQRFTHLAWEGNNMAYHASWTALQGEEDEPASPGHHVTQLEESQTSCEGKLRAGEASRMEATLEAWRAVQVDEG